jgi:hypothetical protein
MAGIIFAGVQALNDEKGYLLDSYIYPALQTSPLAISSY